MGEQAFKIRALCDPLMGPGAKGIPACLSRLLEAYTQVPHVPLPPQDKDRVRCY